MPRHITMAVLGLLILAPSGWAADAMAGLTDRTVYPVRAPVNNPMHDRPECIH
jgi:hypothetical protein